MKIATKNVLVSNVHDLIVAVVQVVCATYMKPLSCSIKATVQCFKQHEDLLRWPCGAPLGAEERNLEYDNVERKIPDICSLITLTIQQYQQRRLYNSHKSRQLGESHEGSSLQHSEKN